MVKQRKKRTTHGTHKVCLAELKVRRSEQTDILIAENRRMGDLVLESKLTVNMYVEYLDGALSTKAKIDALTRDIDRLEAKYNTQEHIN